MELILFSNLACLSSYEGQFLLLEQFIANRELYFRGLLLLLEQFGIPKELCRFGKRLLGSKSVFLYVKFEQYHLFNSSLIIYTHKIINVVICYENT